MAPKTQLVKTQRVIRQQSELKGMKQMAMFLRTSNCSETLPFVGAKQ